MTILTPTTIAQLIAGSILFYSARAPLPQPVAASLPTPKDTHP